MAKQAPSSAVPAGPVAEVEVTHPPHEDTGHRDNRPSWDDYFMSIAEAVKSRSPDETKVGAVIVREKTILATGYNGFARGVQEHEWRSAEKREKLRWAVHAEQNAIFNAARVGISVEGTRIYTTKFPCLKCMNAIVQTGIIEIYTYDEKPYDDELIKDDGRRVTQILMETSVRLISPKLRLAFGPLHTSARGA